MRGNAVHGKALLAGNGSCIYSGHRHYEQAPLLAAVEIGARRLKAFVHRLIGNEDNAGAGILGLTPHSLFGRRDERRHEHTAIGRSMKPLRAFTFQFGRRIGAVHHHLLLERIVEQLKIAIRTAYMARNSNATDTPEEIRMLAPHSQPPRIVPEVPVQHPQRATGVENLVVESFLKYRVAPVLCVYPDFKPCYGMPEWFRNRLLHKNKYMYMIRHHCILQKFH